MKTILKFIFVCFLALQIQAQEKLITGVVTSSTDGLPLPGVSIVIMGTKNGTDTDFDGKFEIKAAPTDSLSFNYIGFKTKVIKVGTQEVISVALEEDLDVLDEVVVVGYGTRKVRHLTGAISKVTSSIGRKKRQKQSYQNQLASQISHSSVDDALQGQVSGVTIANPKESKIIIRGVGSINNSKNPLVVIDGRIASHKDLQKMNPNNLKSVDVLKDASSTAIYGSRGSNGVIMVTTKNNSVKPQEEPLYIVDGNPIKKENNYIIENLSDTDIKSKKEYSRAKAVKKFGKIAKKGCVEITTVQGNFQINNNESYAVIEENNFERTTLSPLSTFSIDVDNASYSNVRRMINNGETIEPDAVKIEEMINYFDYQYPQPTDEHPFAIHTEVAKTPWHSDTKIVRIGLQGKTYANEELPASNLTFLIDVSGSMDSSNKLGLLKSVFKLLVNQLREKDKVSIVVYAGAAGVVLKPTSGKHKKEILKALDNLQAGGSTAGGAGIKLAYKIAKENFKKNGNNRVILATDGDFNVGASSDKAMEKLIEKERESGVFLSVLGFGYGNYKDSKLETLADKGNGNHAYIDTMQEAQKVFGKEFGGTLHTIAKDVKIQVEFNPAKVEAYRLIGYENRMLEDEDFVDDTKDAGELGSGHSVTALYEVIPKGIESDYLKDVDDLKYTKATEIKENYQDELFTVKFRYKKPDANESVEMVHVQKDEVIEASEDFKFASAVALFGMQLRQSKFFNNATSEQLISLAKSGRGEDENGYRAEFLRLVKTVNQ